MGTNGVAGKGSATEIRFGIEPFDVGYGAGFQVDDESSLAVECEIVEDDGALRVHDPSPAVQPPSIAFVDGSLRVEARLTRTDASGTVSGITGCASAGCVVVERDRPSVVVAEEVVRRYAIFTCDQLVDLPDQPGGWTWHANRVPETDVDAATHLLQRHMRDWETALAERHARQGVLTVLDGPLSNVRSRRDLPVIGYVKTHRRRMLDAESWARVTDIDVGQRTSVFRIADKERDDRYASYLRVGDPGPWSSPWGGIVRLEVPVGSRDDGLSAIDAAAAWLPRFASRAHRDPRAPVNLTPIGGLERRLRRLHGDARLAARAARAAIVALNGAEAA